MLLDLIDLFIDRVPAGGLEDDLNLLIWAEAEKPEVIPWHNLVTETLNEDVRLDASGLIRFEASIDKHHRGAARAACRRYEAKANQICERRGGEVATVRAGAIVTVLCPDCVE